MGCWEWFGEHSTAGAPPLSCGLTLTLVFVSPPHGFPHLWPPLVLLSPPSVPASPATPSVPPGFSGLRQLPPSGRQHSIMLCLHVQHVLIMFILCYICMFNMFLLKYFSAQVYGVNDKTTPRVQTAINSQVRSR